MIKINTMKNSTFTQVSYFKKFLQKPKVAKTVFIITPFVWNLIKTQA